ncbi:MAG: GvpL/GvpF family gas vesicle protein [Pseudomonadota bacterium]
MIYLYGLTNAPDASALDTLEGVTGPVQTTALESGPTLIHSPHDGAEVRAKRKALLAHARVLETALTSGTVLPMRFGLVARDLDEVAELVAAKSATIDEHFDRLSGLIELGLRVTFDTQQALQYQLSRDSALAAQRAALAKARSDHMAQAEFGRRLGDALDRHRTDCQRALLTALRPHVSDLVVRTPEAEAQLLAADILIPADAQDDIAQRVDTLARDTGFLPEAEPQIRLVGPVPPYNFVRFDLGRLAEPA